MLCVVRTNLLLGFKLFSCEVPEDGDQAEHVTTR